MGKVRAMLDHRGTQLKTAGPSTPVEILGLGGVPDAGDTLNTVTDEKELRALIDFYSYEHGASVMTKMQPFMQRTMGQLNPAMMSGHHEH